MKTLYRSFCKAEVFVCSVLFVALVAVVFLAVILRGFRISFAWNMDIALLILPWVSFLGADCAFRSGNLVGIDMLTRQFRPVLRNIIEIVVLILVLAFLGVIVYYGAVLVATDWDRQYNSLPISFSWVVLSLPAASLSMIITAILKLKERFSAFKNIKDGIKA
ncbi:MAG: TRAP transporter small permease [Elusimicrobiota bacterium]|jgi:TRAP-type C4-dicarboxylate transport system permease small subunit|nr:TRAP transporter small permease [Elusimicrobiota bacterium]